MWLPGAPSAPTASRCTGVRATATATASTTATNSTSTVTATRTWPFGIGIHRCVGRHFARMQLDIGITRLLNRLTGFRLAPGTEVRRSVGISVGAPRELHLRFDRVTP
ncbi:cytochrome P450 [Nocardia sp. CA-151230]|uniref:cytochrome P450 n=1 Tax=Nocardia sp. CA-151230 TaxID=3239982 RepID=UPI003D904FF8